ncbi:hypothetical protein CPB84DRAFT_1748012 [Gymnopilus junonius]|uniref:Uncharacterized protein n=1 Tax=Gymnopilus junonius TaxID=109634 RepID=A0A9P5NM58_GYMJU|nr:hypothetical protein CPB84DRAFT_1748012 [Gymnopilus junonius]
MPTAKGNIISQNGAKFVATFIIDEIQYIFSGNTNHNPGAFSVTKATLNYDSKDQLTSTHSYLGQVGITKVTFNVKNGPTAAGPLPDNRQVDPASTVDGSGTWTTA